MVDDGQAGAFTQFGEVLNGYTYTIDVTGLTLGSEHRFKIVASNHIGNRDSNIVKSVAADEPNAPVNAPGFIQAETNTTSIRVSLEKVTEDGGSPILSYHL